VSSRHYREAIPYSAVGTYRESKTGIGRVDVRLGRAYSSFNIADCMANLWPKDVKEELEKLLIQSSKLSHEIDLTLAETAHHELSPDAAESGDEAPTEVP
jgi:hypothetical protein